VRFFRHRSFLCPGKRWRRREYIHEIYQLMRRDLRFLILTLISIIFFSTMRGKPVTEDELFARRPMGMRMAMVVRQWRAIIDSAITDTGLTQSAGRC
jgi:hypothetical protein